MNLLGCELLVLRRNNPKDRFCFVYIKYTAVFKQPKAYLSNAGFAALIRVNCNMQILLSFDAVPLLWRDKGKKQGYSSYNIVSVFRCVLASL